jgi:hypothetical protein
MLNKLKGPMQSEEKPINILEEFPWRIEEVCEKLRISIYIE